MMSDPIVRVQADMPDAVVRIEVANQGKDGYTPKRGVDYWTEEDVQEIHDYVDEQIGTGSGAVISVNGKTGAVVLTPADIGAQPKGDYALKEEVPQIDDAAVRAESTWSSKNTVERFLPEFSESGAAVECHPFPLCPLNVSTTFEPAQTGSGDPYPAGGGKNLLRPEWIKGNTTSSAYDKRVSSKYTIPIFAGETYTLSADNYTDFRYVINTDATNSTYPFTHTDDEPNALYAECGNLTTWSQAPITFTATHDGYLAVCVSKPGDAMLTVEEVQNLNIQLELGSTATEYAPYSNVRPISGYDKLELTQTDEIEDRNTYTVHLGDMVYGGAYDWSKGELVVEWKMLPLNGTEAFATSSSWENKYGFYCDGLMSDSVKVAGYDTIANIKCSHAGISTPSRITHDVSSSVAVGQGVETRLYVCLGEFPTVADFKAYLAAQYAAGTPVQIAYKLAEPITIQLAPLEIMPLDGTNVLISNPGDTTVSGKLDPIYLHEQNKAAAAKLAGMETRLRALESAAVNNA